MSKTSLPTSDKHAISYSVKSRHDDLNLRGQGQYRRNLTRLYDFQFHRENSDSLVNSLRKFSIANEMQSCAAHALDDRIRTVLMQNVITIMTTSDKLDRLIGKHSAEQKDTLLHMCAQFWIYVENNTFIFSALCILYFTLYVNTQTLSLLELGLRTL